MQKKFLSAIAICSLFVIVECGPDKQPVIEKPTPPVAAESTVDNGIGTIKSVQLTHPLDEAMIGKGESIYKTKCFACHKLTDEKLVGPGWKGVTDRRTPEWIMNFAINTDVMLDSNLVAQQLMVVCIARMPNQNLTAEDARNVLEYMRKNDGKK